MLELYLYLQYVALVLIVFSIETGGAMLFFINQPSFDELVLGTMKFYNYADRNEKSQSYQLTKIWQKYQDDVRYLFLYSKIRLYPKHLFLYSKISIKLRFKSSSTIDQNSIKKLQIYVYLFI